MVVSMQIQNKKRRKAERRDPNDGRRKETFAGCIFRRASAPRPLILCPYSAETMHGNRADCARRPRD